MAIVLNASSLQKVRIKDSKSPGSSDGTTTSASSSSAATDPEKEKKRKERKPCLDQPKRMQEKAAKHGDKVDEEDHPSYVTISDDEGDWSAYRAHSPILEPLT